ncbi:MAG: exo-alpha-sialidase [Alphaproteobacteria bacterium]|nr:exo-alpha-sialidase [Alphaproteobacteria bacterium]
MIRAARSHRLGEAFAALLLFAAPAQAAPPYRVVPGLFVAARPDDLGLKPAPGTQSFTIFRPRAGAPHYANGVVLMPFKGKLYAQWQASARDEDAPDTFVAYSRSRDGEHWSAPQTLVPSGRIMHSSGGWWTDGKILVAYDNAWPGGFDHHQGGYAEYRSSTDGMHWSKARRVMGADGKPVDGVIEQDPHALPDGRIITAFHRQPGLIVAPYYTDDPTGIAGWTKGLMQNLPHNGAMSRELEPSWFRRRDGAVVMVFRDQDSSFRQLAAASADRGATWTTPVVTDMPDSRAKQSAGNLPDGTAFLVNEPSGTKRRVPLVVTLSRDGGLFDKAFLLRGGADLQTLRFPGKYKNTGYDYPKSVLWKGWLYVGYATNKEDVQLTRVPVKSLRD